jgi:L-asparaginase II
MDKLTAARLARDGEAPSPIRHQCSGFHAASLLLSRHKGWSLADYWKPEHPSQVAVREVVAQVFGVPTAALRTSVDACGLFTYAFPLADIARAFLLLAAPRGPLAGSLTRVRDAMMAAPDMVGGTRDATDTRLMKALPGAVVVKGGAESLRGIGLLAGARGGSSSSAGVAIKIDDGDPNARANRAVTIESLSQLGVVGGSSLERLADLHRPPMVDPRGHVVGEAVAKFELAPLSELA